MTPPTSRTVQPDDGESSDLRSAPGVATARATATVARPSFAGPDASSGTDDEVEPRRSAAAGLPRSTRERSVPCQRCFPRTGRTTWNDSAICIHCEAS